MRSIIIYSLIRIFAKKMGVMIASLLLTLAIVLIGILLLGIKVFFTKGGRFPNTHIGGSKAMKARGIGCLSTQDREARKENKNKIDVKQL